MNYSSSCFNSYCEKRFNTIFRAKSESESQDLPSCGRTYITATKLKTELFKFFYSVNTKFSLSFRRGKILGSKRNRKSISQPISKTVSQPELNTSRSWSRSKRESVRGSIGESLGRSHSSCSNMSSIDRYISCALNGSL